MKKNKINKKINKKKLKKKLKILRIINNTLYAVQYFASGIGYPINPLQNKTHFGESQYNRY